MDPSIPKVHLMNNKMIPWSNSVIEKSMKDKVGSFDRADISLLTEVAHILDAPESLHGFVVALGNFQEILPCIIEYYDKDDGVYSEILMKLNGLRTNIFIAAKGDLLSTNHCCYCGSNPLYTVLLSLDVFKLPRHKSLHLIAMFYIKYISTWHQMSESLRERVGLAMRSTCEGRGFSNDTFYSMYQSLDLESMSALSTSLLEIEEKGKDQLRPAQKTYIRALYLLFNGDIGKKKWGGGGGGNRGGATRLPDLPINPVIPTKTDSTVDDEDEHGNGIGNLLIHQEVGTKQRLDAQKLGLAPGDATSGREAATEEGSSKQRRMKYRALQVYNGIASSNQFLPTQWHQLNSYDIYVLAKELIALSERQFDEFGIPSPLLAAAIVSSFSRGNSLNYVTKTRVVRKMINTAFNHLLLLKKGKKWMAKWLIDSSLDMINGHKFMSEMSGLSRLSETNKTVVLDLPDWIAEILGAADIARKKLNLNKRHNFLFPGTEAEYQSAAKKVLMGIRKKYPSCRLTLNRIEKYFVQCCMQSARFDLAETAYTHGNIHIIQETQIYYTSVSKEQISDIYRKLWIQIESIIQKERMATEGKHSRSSTPLQMTIGSHRNATSFLGSKITPTSKGVSNLVVFLKKNVAEASKRRMPLWKQAIAFHNAYTTYTLLFLAYASGYRAAQDPFPDPRFLDEKTGFLVISDKDFDDSYCTRIIWLSPECVKQMKFYRSHIEAVVNRLGLINHQSFKDLYASLHGWKKMPDKPKKKMRMENFQMPPFLFYLTDEGHCSSISPSDISKVIHDIFPFPMNANRHYLRTELVERKCPTEIIDAFMGHWHRGREPWGQYSSLSPQGYAKVIESKLEEMLCENGWKAIRSIES